MASEGDLQSVDSDEEFIEESKENISWVERRIHDDFKREMTIYRQAQASVLECIPKLHKLGILTKRPEGLKMVKTDDHMEKVQEELLSKQVAMERSEKARKLRELRKYGKKSQIGRSG